MNKQNTSITISDFIEKTIVEITNGLCKAQEKTRNQGTQIFPNSYIDKPTKSNINFNIAITQVSKENELSIGFSICGFNMENGNEEKNSQFINSINFNVEVGFVIFHNQDEEAPSEGFAMSGGTLMTAGLKF